jgi:D-3-phosphoglycerate dehydrogenase
MKFVIIDDLHPSIFEYLKAANITWDYFPDIKAQEVKAILPQYDGLMVRSKLFVDDALLEGSNLKLIARAGAGVDNIDESALAKRNIVLVNAPEGNCDAVAEHTIGFILALLNNFRKSSIELNELTWLREENRGYELSYLTVGVIGYGYMGKALCKLLQAFGCTILVYDHKPVDIIHQNTRQVSLEELKEKTDILSVHIPLIAGNEYFINGLFLQSFKKNIWLVNTSRGKVLHTAEVLPLVRSGKIRGLALDVWENENPQKFNETEKAMFMELRSLPQVMMTPHVAGWTFESYQKISEYMGKKIVAWRNKN